MKVALVHEWIANMGGSEKVLLELHKMFPEAPIYTTVYNAEKVDPKFRDIDIRTSFIQKLPFAKEKYQMYLPLMPMAFEQFDFRDFDLIISSSHACAKGIITPPHAIHVSYCHTPMRYAWSHYHEYMALEKPSQFKRFIMIPLLHYLRTWDRLSSDRVDYFIANSQEVKRRIFKYYRRESVVIHPPVELSTNIDVTSTEDEDYYLIVSRLVSYKRVDLAIKAFNKIKKPLIIIGDGPEMNKLKKIAGPTIQLLGKQDNQVVESYYKRCKAFVFPGEEDFGITPVEAQSYGKPVIAYGKGGVLDTVTDGLTGVYFYDQTVDDVIKALNEFEQKEFDKELIRIHSRQFSNDMFVVKISDFIKKVLIKNEI